MHDAEAVGDEGVGELGELVGERAALGVVLAGLARVEADVLQHRDLAVLERRRPSRAALSPTVSVANATVAAEQLAEPGGRPGAREYAGSGAPFGPAEVGDHDDPGAGVGQLPDGRDAGPDPAVVGDRAAVERHVEVGADQDPLARQRRRGRRGRRARARSERLRRRG